MDLIVASVATELMGISVSTLTQASEQVLRRLAEQFDADGAFFRRYDRDIRASTLVAEWPPPGNGSDPDPRAAVVLECADRVFAQCDNSGAPIVVRDGRPHGRMSRWCRGASRTEPAGAHATAVAPLVCDGVTTGVLGFVKFGAGSWKKTDLNTLTSVAPLFAQLQERIAAEEELRYLVDHDDLTGLLNRRALLARLGDRLAVGQPGPVAVLYVDVDGLKSINDNLGHTAGDWFIQLFAERLRTCAGGHNLIARLGGDEFIVVPDQPMSASAAESFARSLETTLCKRTDIAIGRQTITRTVSIGLAVGTPGHDDGADLISRADEAVLAAKRAGGNQVALSTDDMDTKSALRHDIERHLRGDIESDVLQLHYLPEIDLRTGAVVAMEALVRWQHPVWGPLPPDSFIGVAESADLAEEFGRWVLRSACADFSRWRSRGVGQRAVLRINVSPVQLVTRDFVRSVAETIEEFGIDGGSVCLEITERAVVHDIEVTRKTLSALKEVGVQIAIDDFGTGYAVLSHLKSLPVDILKIDASFVSDLGTDAGDLAIVRAVIGLAEAFGLDLVAEGVETPIAAITLMQHGCNRVQGFLLSRPLTADAMEALLSLGWISMPFLADRAALAPSTT